MLVLNRNPGESIVIGGSIEVVVVESRPDGRVRLGITAPKEISIFRKEIADAIKCGGRGKAVAHGH